MFRAFVHAAMASVFVLFCFRNLAVSHPYMLSAITLTLCCDLMLRYAARKRLHASRARGHAVLSVLAVGGADAIVEFAAQMSRDKYYTGMRVTGACLVEQTPAAVRSLADANVPVFGDVDSIVRCVRDCGADRVVVLAGEVRSERLRWLSWQLEGVDVDLAVVPGLVEIAGRRLHVQPMSGLALLHVDQPQFTGFRRAIKGAFDRLLAALILLVLWPVLLVVGLVVRMTSPGPALFRQTRCGVGGNTFTLYKFRSMVCDAEQQLAGLQSLNEKDGCLFKMRNDPQLDERRRTAAQVLPR